MPFYFNLVFFFVGFFFWGGGGGGGCCILPLIGQMCLFRQTDADYAIFVYFRSDAWLTKGIAGYLSCLFQKKTFGNNEYRYMIAMVR